jgi:predicted small secreted protein
LETQKTIHVLYLSLVGGAATLLSTFKTTAGVGEDMSATGINN